MTTTNGDYIRNEVQVLENNTKNFRRKSLKEWQMFCEYACNKMKSTMTHVVSLEDWNIRYELIHRLKNLSMFVKQTDDEFKATQNAQQIAIATSQPVAKPPINSESRIHISQARIPNGPVVGLSVFQNSQQSRQTMLVNSNVTKLLPSLVPLNHGETLTINDATEVNTFQEISQQLNEDNSQTVMHRNITQTNQATNHLGEVKSESEAKNGSPSSSGNENIVKYMDVSTDPEVSLSESVPSHVEFDLPNNGQTDSEFNQKKQKGVSNSKTVVLYGCSYTSCSKTFKQSDSLERHMKSHLSDYVCSHDLCGKRFSTAVQLERHQRGHVMNVCPRCCKTFKSPSILKRHELTHLAENEKEFGCTTCPKRYATAAQLNRHQQGHLVNKQFNCPHCSKHYLSNYNLRKHLKNHHPDFEMETIASVERVSSEDGDTCDALENLTQVEFGQSNEDTTHIETTVETISLGQESTPSDSKVLGTSVEENIDKATELPSGIVISNAETVESSAMNESLSNVNDTGEAMQIM